jgi:DNA invertase Pin-like site-specific DNA recombinase
MGQRCTDHSDADHRPRAPFSASLSLLELREFAARQGWNVVREYTDEATAKNGERAGFKEMWADVAKHRFDLTHPKSARANAARTPGTGRR